MGFLEYIIVTPSQHRVHHAINPIYIDKNLSAIFCVWDRIFGTFQEELDSEPPIYGTLKPVQSWNPVWINFQHFWILLRDAWYTKDKLSKIKIWFMPTGWRPPDVIKLFPLVSRESQPLLRYNPKYSKSWKFVAIFHFSILVFMIIFLLSRFSELETSFQLSFGLLIMYSIFGFTALMDFYSWAPIFEQLRGILGLVFISLPQHKFLLDNYPFSYGLLVIYFLATLGLGLWAKRYSPHRRIVLN